MAKDKLNKGYKSKEEGREAKYKHIKAAFKSIRILNYANFSL